MNTRFLFCFTLLVSAFHILSGACSSTSACDSGELLSIVHFSAGDAPFASTLVIRADGGIVLEYAEGDRFQGEISSSQIDELRDLIESADWQTAEAYVDYRSFPHRELVVIQQGGSTYNVVIEHTPPVLKPLFQLIDEIAVAEFGEDYDQPLIVDGRPDDSDDQ